MAIAKRQFDAVVVGAGGSGMRAALQLAEANLKVAVLSKVFPRARIRSRRKAASPRRSAMTARTTGTGTCTTRSKGRTTSATRTRSSSCAARRTKRCIELEHYGMPFDRTPTARYISARSAARRATTVKARLSAACAAADRTGHAMLHTLYQRNVRAHTQFFVEWMALDLMRDPDGDVLGVVAMEMETGEVMILQAKATLLATGGAGRIYAASTNAFINTGDGLGMAARAGIPLEDMEFWQFHPTGVAGAGVLITEGVRGEGGFLLNKNGERFMERYAPTVKDLAQPRRRVARDGDRDQGRPRRGQGRRLHPAQARSSRRRGDRQALPGIREIAKKFANVDPVTDPIPVVPTCHYQMGGIPTNYHGQVVRSRRRGRRKDRARSVCGRRVRVRVRAWRESSRHQLAARPARVRQSRRRADHRGHRRTTRAHKDLPNDAGGLGARAARAPRRRDGGRKRGRGAARTCAARCRCTAACSAFPTVLPKACGKCKEIAERVKRTYIKDKSKVFNTARVEALELDNLVETARRDHDVRGRAQGKPRRARPQRSSTIARRRELAEAHVLVQGRQPPRVQAGAS